MLPQVPRSHARSWRDRPRLGPPSLASRRRQDRHHAGEAYVDVRLRGAREAGDREVALSFGPRRWSSRTRAVSAASAGICRSPSAGSP